MHYRNGQIDQTSVIDLKSGNVRSLTQREGIFECRSMIIPRADEMREKAIIPFSTPSKSHYVESCSAFAFKNNELNHSDYWFSADDFRVSPERFTWA
jgi:hypothetical protein